MNTGAHVTGKWSPEGMQKGLNASFQCLYMRRDGCRTLMGEVWDPLLMCMTRLQVTYTFTQTTLFNEPLLLIAAYMTVFFLAIVWQRSDFSIAVCVLVIRQ
jgi:hypothetical protein